MFHRSLIGIFGPTCFLLCAFIFSSCLQTELTPSQVSENHTAMFDAVKAYVDQPELFVNGEWQQHWGDGSFFGPSFDLAQWTKTGEQKHLDRALEALEVNRLVVLDAAENFTENMDNLETVSMSLLSLLEAGLYLDDTAEYLEAADALIEVLDKWAILLDDYMSIDAGEFAATTYGPTSLSAFIVLIHLEHVLGYPEADPEYHKQRAQEAIENIHWQAWSDDLGAYRFAPGDDRLMLYPNATMLIAHARAYQLIGDPWFLEQFEVTYEGIQGLKDEDGDHYHSPYSAESMGATDDDYTTHSSQNYLMMGLLVAYQATGKTAYLEEVDIILGFLDAHLLVDGQILHHWMNGRAATEEDPYLYCLGCNVQTLYILLMLGAMPAAENPV